MKFSFCGSMCLFEGFLDVLDSEIRGTASAAVELQGVGGGFPIWT